MLAGYGITEQYEACGCSEPGTGDEHSLMNPSTTALQPASLTTRDLLTFEDSYACTFGYWLTQCANNSEVVAITDDLAQMYLRGLSNRTAPGISLCQLSRSNALP